MNNLIQTKPNFDLLPGGWDCTEDWAFTLTNPGVQHYNRFSISLINNAIAEPDCNKLIDLFHRSPKVENVSIQGRKDIVDDRVGSTRTTMWNELLAKRIWENIKYFIPDVLADDYTSTDFWQQNPNNIRDWEPIGVSPMLRIMKYQGNGEHYAHYDAGYIYEDPNYRTLKSVVIYLTTNENQGGCTRFIDDHQWGIPMANRNTEDWTERTPETKVYFSSTPIKGNILVFDHRLCHDVQVFTGDTRMIIRTDIIYKAKTK